MGGMREMGGTCLRNVLEMRQECRHGGMCENVQEMCQPWVGNVLEMRICPARAGWPGDMPDISRMVLGMRVCRARAGWPGIVREMHGRCASHVLEPRPPGPGPRCRSPGPGGRGSSTFLEHASHNSRTIPGHSARARQTRISNTIPKITGTSKRHPARAGQTRMPSTCSAHV